MLNKEFNDLLEKLRKGLKDLNALDKKLDLNSSLDMNINTRNTNDMKQKIREIIRNLKWLLVDSTNLI